MLIVVALGGNALLRPGDPLRPATQEANVRRACEALAPLATEHELVITHGNGPQVGLLAEEDAGADPLGLDVLDAETEGMIGYLIERELRNATASRLPVATVLTMIEVDPGDPAFNHPTKPIGPERNGRRRRVPSPEPRRVLEIEAIRSLLASGCVVVCTGGGGIPVVRGQEGLSGVEAVIDKDLASALLAEQLAADLLVIATDVDGVYLDWGKPTARLIREASPDELPPGEFAAGSMGPKVEAAKRFARAGGEARIVGLGGLAQCLEGGGTRIAPAGTP